MFVVNLNFVMVCVESLPTSWFFKLLQFFHQYTAVIFVITNCVIKKKVFHPTISNLIKNCFIGLSVFLFKFLYLCSRRHELMNYSEIRRHWPGKSFWFWSRKLGHNTKRWHEKYCSVCSQCCMRWNMSRWLLAGLYRSKATLMFCL